MGRSAISHQQLQDTGYRASCIVHHATYSLRYALIVLTLLLLPAMAQAAAPQMADYCYLPPFVTDPNTPPNIMVVYEKGADIIN